MSDEEEVDDYDDDNISNGAEEEENLVPRNPFGEREAFDTDLPASHTYLGQMENLQGYTVYDDGQIVELPAIFTNTLVFPGFTLPLVTGMEFNVRNTDTFILTCHDEKDNSKVLFDYGVVMEIFETTPGTDRLKARGRHRCRLLPGQSHLFSRRRTVKLKAQILPEFPVTSPLCGTQLAHLKRVREMDWSPDKINNKHRKFHLAQFPQASWVYDHHEVKFFVKHIIDKIRRYFPKIEMIPTDPTLLSYWLVQNFQLTHGERLKILESNTTQERLRKELYFIQLKRKFCCGTCGAFIATESDVFPMSRYGVQSNYCNPNGVVFETLTFTGAKNIVREGFPCLEFSWFPGYYWTILKCVRCMCHLGWEFTSKHLEPSRFYGLGHSCLKIQVYGGSKGDSEEFDEEEGGAEEELPLL